MRFCFVGKGVNLKTVECCNLFWLIGAYIEPEWLGVVIVLWAGQFGVQFLEGERFFLSPKCLDQLQGPHNLMSSGPHNLMSSGYCGSCPRCKRKEV